MLATSRAFRSLGFRCDLINGTHLVLRTRQRGFSEAQMIETVLLLQTIGGDCPEDLGLLAGDGCLERGLGYRAPKPTTLREFLELFHDPDLEAMRPPREIHLSFIVASSMCRAGAAGVLQAGGVRNIAARYEEPIGQRLSIATIDQDATIIESHKKAAYAHYQGGRGYQPIARAVGRSRPDRRRPVPRRQRAGQAGAAELRADGVRGAAGHGRRTLFPRRQRLL